MINLVDIPKCLTSCVTHEPCVLIQSFPVTIGTMYDSCAAPIQETACTEHSLKEQDMGAEE